MKKPTTSEDWMILELEISALFDGAPIDEEELFAGRSAEVTKILRAVLTRSKHVVLYGERGVGKTSLSNVFWKRFNKTLKSFVVARVQADPSDTFALLWTRALEELKSAGKASGKDDYVNFDTEFDILTPSVVRRELQKCKSNALPVIIIDEYSEIEDVEAKRLTASLIKQLYDFTVTTTIVIVGVAQSVGGLIGDHASLDRALIEVPLGRMSIPELREVIVDRASRTVMAFSGDAIWTIVVLSRGLPYFTQTLAKHAALNAISNRRVAVDSDDVEASMKNFIEDAEQAFKDRYRDATRSNQDNFFQQSLLACALAKTDDEGFFVANDIVEPYSAIMKGRRRIAHFENI